MQFPRQFRERHFDTTKVWVFERSAGNGTTYEDVVMKYHYDIKGQLIRSIDPYDRVISLNVYDTAGRMLKTTHIDRGEQTLTPDAMGLPVITLDAKGARVLMTYDILNRPTNIRARDTSGESTTLRQILRYGDSDGLPAPENQNLKGKLYVHNDEAGRLVYTDYDFKGNLLNHYRQLINDNALTPYQKYVVNWDAFNPSHLSSTQNTITREYDALNRIRKAKYPQDRAGQRKEMTPKYNKGGALLSLKVGGTDFVKEIAYNARGQRILVAMGNGVMTRSAYDPQTFRMARTRSEKFTKSGHTYTPNGGVQQDLAYTYDLEGSILTQNDQAPANASAQGPGDLLRVFTHDPLRRLLSATGRESSNVYQQPSWDLNIRPHDHTATNTYTRSYAYDKLGNIQMLKHVADGKANQDFVRHYEYGTGDNRLKTFVANGTAYENLYDPNGNLTKEGENRHYEWNANDKLAVFKNQAGSSTPTVYTNYFYNAQGERVKKHTRKGNKVTVTFYMDGGIFETSYVKPTGGSIDNNRFYNTIKISDASTSLSTGGSLIATIRIGNNADDATPGIKYIVGDHLNNSTAVLKTTGSLINREEYYPFGETSFGGFAKKRYRFNGKEKDEESGLYNYGQRLYAPWLCRFVSVDPIAEDFPQLSSFNYAGNKPVTSPDIEGLQGTEDAPVDTSTQSQGTAETSNAGLLNIEIHQVQQGETISDLANQYNVSQDAIRRANPQTQNRSQADQINIGENIVIPMNHTSDSSGFGDYNSRDAEGLKYIPFDADYQKNLEWQPNATSSTTTEEPSFGNLASDVWNSPIARMIVPDKMTITLSSSVTAIFGTYTGLDFHWITRGHDANIMPYPTFSVGGQIGTKASANALIGMSRGYFLTSDVRKLEEKKAAQALLGISVEMTGGIGVVAGVEGSLSIGIDDKGFQTLDYGISGGFSIGGGLSGGANYTIPIIPSQFAK